MTTRPELKQNKTIIICIYDGKRNQSNKTGSKKRI